MIYLTSFSGKRSQDGLQYFPHIGGDDFVTLRGWVNAVGKVELTAAAHSLQNKRDEQRLVLFCDIDEDRFELSAVVATHVRRNLYPRHNYFDFRVLSLGPLNDRLKIALGRFRR